MRRKRKGGGEGRGSERKASVVSLSASDWRRRNSTIHAPVTVSDSDMARLQGEAVDKLEYL